MTADSRRRFSDAIGLYNRGEYLACQEALEQIHAETAVDEQPLVRALLLLACGMHLHFHRGGGRGTLNLFRQSLVALDDFRPRRLGVEVDDLFEALQAYVEDLQERNKSGARFLDRWLAPRIKHREESEA